MQEALPQPRMTKQRMVILEELRKLHTHPTADEIYALVRRRMPRISLGTVYRNLDFLSESGDIVKLEVAGSIRRFDATTTPHCHVRCVRCGCVADVHGASLPTDVGAAEAPGFTITGARMEFDGLCDACRAAAS